MGIDKTYPMKRIIKGLREQAIRNLNQLLIWDRESLKWIRENGSLKRLTNFFTTATYLGDGWLWGALALSIFIFDNRRLVILLLGFSVVFINKILVLSIKHYFKRPRPKSLPPNLRSKIVQKYSFPSGHSTDSFSIAFLMAHFYPLLPLQVGIYLLSALISFSRLYVGEHYPTDVITGALLGIAMSDMLLKLSQKVMAWL